MAGGNFATSTALASAFLLGAATGIALFQALLRKKKTKNEDCKTNLGESSSCPAPRRFGAAIRLKREKYRRYRELHDNIWPAVLERMYQSNIRNFVIYYHEQTSTMFQSFEWIGHWTTTTAKGRPFFLSPQEERQLFDRDMKAIADDPITRKWWKECEPCQEPFQHDVCHPPPSEGGSGDWWSPMECVCHAGHWPTTYSCQRYDPEFAKLAKE